MLPQGPSPILIHFSSKVSQKRNSFFGIPYGQGNRTSNHCCLLQRFQTCDEANNQYTFESLTPFADSELGIYESALDYVFEHPEIRNIALSGSYGAGKSSVLASYEKKHEKERNYLHISLAHFTDESEVASDQVKESVLEGKILNQLIHQISPSRIPQTNFRIKEATSKRTVIWFSVVFSLMILLVLHLILSSTWENYLGSFPDGWVKNLLLISSTPYAYLISGFLLTGIMGFAIYQIVRLQRDRRIFKKLNLQGNEIELFGDSNESYFDKYLNEVLYLFENADADVIVFEDMDRFNATQIFERLREVNTLINLKTDKRTIRFFYLLKDDIFTSKDRTKFFDFIIPIVPVVDGSNSYDQFITHLQKNNLLDKFDERFLKGLSLYVDEMRLLKNICNEFLIYYNRLNTTELDYNIPHDTKVSILASILPYIGREDATHYLSDLGLSEYIRIFDPHSKPKFPINANNEELLDAFKEKGWIYEYVEDSDRDGFYKIRRRPISKPTPASK